MLTSTKLRDFNIQYNKKERSLHRMWAIVAMLGRRFHDDDIGTAYLPEDGDRVYATMMLATRALLTALHCIDVGGKLSADSELRDLGWVMSLYLKWSVELAGMDFQEAEETMGYSWEENVVAYARKGNIDLEAAGCTGTKKVLDDITDVPDIDASKKKTADKWEWKKHVRSCPFRMISTILILICAPSRCIQQIIRSRHQPTFLRGTRF